MWRSLLTQAKAQKPAQTELRYVLDLFKTYIQGLMM